MGVRLEELGDDTEVVLVTFTSADDLQSYAADNDLPFTLVRDPNRAAYRAYGLGRGSWSRVWGLKAARRYVELFRQHGLGGLRRPSEDTLQLGGDFVIAPDGTLTYGFWGDGPDDRPSVDELVGAAKNC